nr:MAG TPA: hypothetical protein [Microviridae sp.]
MRKDDLEVLKGTVLRSFKTLLRRTSSYEELKATMVLFSVVDYFFIKLKGEEKNERKN